MLKNRTRKSPSAITLNDFRSGIEKCFILSCTIKKYIFSGLRASGLRLIACGLQRVACSILFLSIFWIFSFAQGGLKYDAKGKRDPFIPLVTPDGRLLKLEKEETISGLLLEGIIYDEHGLSYCLVNGVIVRVSDKIGDYQVLKIEKNKVIFIKSGQTLEVELKEEELP